MVADRAYGNELPPNGWMLRDFILGTEILQNQIRHFYLLALPDYVEFPPVPPFQGAAGSDYRLGPGATVRMVNNYMRAIEASRKCHEMLCVFGGKAPHTHGMVPGGISVPVSADRVLKCLSLLEEVISFLDDCYLPDAHALAEAYPDYFYIGSRPPRFFSSGLFRTGPRMDTALTPPGVLVDWRLEPAETSFIQEHLRYTWLTEADGKCPDPAKPSAYTWCAAPRYRGLAFEVGPLARQSVIAAAQGKPLATSQSPGTATMDRILARANEARQIAPVLRNLLKSLEPGGPTVKHNPAVIEPLASAMIEVPRGTLTHSALLEGDSVAKYNIITPTAWNFSPHDDMGNPGPLEESLIGTQVRDVDHPVEIGRIARAYDPCMSCATHVVRLATGEGGNHSA